VGLPTKKFMAIAMIMVTTITVMTMTMTTIIIMDIITTIAMVMCIVTKVIPIVTVMCNWLVKSGLPILMHQEKVMGPQGLWII
jgi:hypothetical protein